MHRRLLTLAIAALAVVTAGCISIDRPEGPVPLRYRDEIFTNVTKTADVTYGNAPNQGQPEVLKLDVYRPDGDAVTRRPAIVWVHGGSFVGGNKSSPELVDEATTFAKKGFVNVSIDYRLSKIGGCTGGAPPGACSEAANMSMHDAQAAVRFLRANHDTYGVDPDRIGIGGSSAGAITALDVGFNPDDPGTSGNPGPSSAVSGAVSLSGAKLIGTADRGDAPILLFHGTKDPLVPYFLATATVASARDAGIPTFLVTWEGEGHVPYVQHRQQILDTTTNFLYSAMGLANAAR